MDSARKTKYLIFALAAASVCLRAPLTCVGALVGTLKEVFSLSSAVAGLITTIPLLAFAVFSPLMTPLAKRLGTGRLMLLGLAVLTAGVLLRPFTGKAGFFIFTVAIGAGIAVGNVVIPSIIKRYFPGRAASLNGVYTTGTLFSAGLATAFTASLRSTPLGWRGTLAIWAVLSAAAIVIWLPLRGLDPAEKRLSGKAEKATEPETVPGEDKKLARSKVAWYVTLYFGFQSMLFFGVVAWMVSILLSKGMSQGPAGYASTVCFCSGILLSMAYSRIIPRVKDQRLLGPAAALGYLICVLLLALAPWKPAFIAGCIGMGFFCGGLFNSSTFFFTARARSSRQAIKVSGMAQGFGYILTSSSSLLMGLFYDITGSWTVPLLFMAAVAVLSMIFGYLSGKERYV